LDPLLRCILSSIQKLTYTIESKATYETLPILVKAGLKIFYFTGDQDAIVPITGTIYWFDKYRKEKDVAIKRSWRPWVTDDQNISGMIW
jgi:serine carboxypeptidase-like clade II